MMRAHSSDGEEIGHPHLRAHQPLLLSWQSDGGVPAGKRKNSHARAENSHNV